MAREPGGPEAPGGWEPPAGARRRVDPADEWRTSRLSERELTIATAVSIVAAVLVPFVGFILALLLLADRNIPHGIGVIVLAVLSAPLFPLWG